MVVRLARALADEIVEHARAGLPDEACGLLRLRGDELVEFLPAVNQAASPTFYEIGGMDLLGAVAIEDDGDGVAIYHSHVASRAYPSRTDVDVAQETWPDALYLIVSLASDPADLRAYRLAGREVAEVDLAIA